ncbi:Lreu_0056 family protein [Companilactobacillus versmoldensis]|uniref:Uncharacterized protein n=1 Tax=Companilactobacillus versmoldensis DSM 14857 = KCTC 3814 TaxID=1423815 RepID=A0A0R1SCR5_9LACO|nr:DUF4767 domain-containing protein [Companilactobacillus versmoldensis]KRL66880.1 hypothetical protein FC27_GL000326 [Companilactobacillus versmoldensis DSM 14857 = KCTC 3814]
MKKKGLTTALLLVFSVFVLAGCDSQKNDHSSTQQTDSQSTKPLWNYKKDNRLESYMNGFAASQNEKFNKYDGKTPIETSTNATYPKDFSKTKISGSKDTIGWDEQGLSKNDYTVVAIYDSGSANTPLTYFFAFHDRRPVVLVCDTAADKPQLELATDDSFKTVFTKIIKNKSVKNPASGSNESSLQTTETDEGTTDQNKSTDSKDTYDTTDPKMIGAMIYMMSGHDDITMAPQNFSLYVKKGTRYTIYEDNAVISDIDFQLQGKTVHYWTRDPDSSDVMATETQKESTISLSDLVSKYYSTPEQKQIVQDCADKIKEQ